MATTPSSKSKARTDVVLTGLLVAGLAVLGLTGYQRDPRQARDRVSTGSQIAQTPCGAIEYAVAGDGPPVLVVHGTGGRYDQSLAFVEPLVSSGFQIIAMSRFGYLRTALPSDASLAAQADAHACLLDAVDIERVAVIGGSAGAPSAMQLALRHPEQVTALVLLR
jgi:2-hydroxy-6-oxonona-2,4-dienedioate hydrolase